MFCICLYGNAIETCAICGDYRLIIHETRTCWNFHDIWIVLFTLVLLWNMPGEDVSLFIYVINSLRPRTSNNIVNFDNIGLGNDLIPVATFTIGD